MTGPNNNKSFLDKNTVVAIVVSMVFFVAWTTYVKRKYPEADKPPVTAQTVENADAHAKDQPAAVVNDQAAPADATKPAASVAAPATSEQKEEFVSFSSDQLSFEVSSLGMGLRNIDLRAYKARDEKPIVLGAVTSQYPFSTYLAAANQPLYFKVQDAGNNTFKGVAQVGALTVEKTLTIDPARYLITSEVKVSGADGSFKGLTTYISDKLFDQPPSTGLFSGAVEDQDLFYHHEGDEKHDKISKKDGANIAVKNVKVAALSSHYFALALLNKSDILPRLETQIAPNAAEASVRLVHEPVNPGSEFKVGFQAFAGPKQLSVLQSIDPALGDVIHYGIFAWIARPLLSLLKILYGLFSNWGLAIVGLTIIVRLLVAPFNIYSFKSMKVMQRLQPEMQRIREKYKSDPQTMNREVMDLMKRNKANPIGGCLPMLLQLPAFIALYSVLGQSVELYRAPFMLWIHDLSVKDPFYVLPVLMGITMFIQQKITPSPNMDPAQQKVLQFMPILFTFFMISLPSGLTLYIFISTLFGITQQYIFMREKNPDAKISQVQA
jgi:YidC/Oxa1 family membrane protein insertase